MREEITHVGGVAARSATRLYDQNLKPFFDDLKHQEAKEVFASVIMLQASAELFHLLGDGYEEHLDMLVAVMKDRANFARSKAEG
ncbi:hypothetical protein [Acinetobacter sp. MF4640]|uniref:hypothetical protein n=1 Tax=Acinetobacter sp. MF4640 TaxID=1960826 RepID=UPI000995239B|nr:hypothetical protein [Acinetobacter sp. MF4640]OOW09639.1 hypothetical protein MF4640_15925 [Acinetobacter sp. MF4640]